MWASKIITWFDPLLGSIGAKKGVNPWRKSGQKVGSDINAVKDGRNNDLRAFLASACHKVYGVK